VSLIVAFEPQQTESKSWKVYISGIPAKGWKANAPTGWLDMHEQQEIALWCEKHCPKWSWNIYTNYVEFENYDEALLFYMTFAQ
jgi:hypothetical protein